MGSRFHSLVDRFAGRSLAIWFGEKSEGGNLYDPPGNPQAFELADWILSNTVSRSEFSQATGNFRTVQTATLAGPRRLMDENNVFDVQEKATVTIEGVSWSVDSETTIWGRSFVTLGLRRDVLSNFQEGRASNAV